MAKEASSTRSSGANGKSSSSLSSAKPAKALKPLTSFLSGRSTGTSTGTSSSTALATSGSIASTSKSSSKPVAKKQKTNGKLPAAAVAAGKHASDPVDAIELSSDDDIGDEIQVKEDDEDSEDDVVVTGFNAPSASTSKSGPISKKQTASTVKTGKILATPIVTKATQSSENVSAKAKGKQRAANQDTVELEVTDTRADALWSEKYSPVDFDSLCVHKKKVQDVQRWLEEAYAGGVMSKYRRVMILSGPAGSGKTATLRVLSKEMGFEIIEYKTSEGDSESFSNQFPTFLSKATLTSSLMFGTLTADNKIALPPPPAPSTSSSTAPPSTASAFKSFKPLPPTSTSSSISKSSKPLPPPSISATRRLILVEDLPNIFTSQVTRTSFRSALLAYANNKRINSSLAVDANVPLVVIVSEALTRPGQNEGENAVLRYQGSGEQSVSVRSVVPPEVMRAPGSAEFKFNSVAVTFMKKALTAIAEREYSTNPAKKPSARAIQLVIEASDGDIRSALNTLQFVVGHSAENALGGEELEEKGGKAKKGKKRKASGKLKEDEDEGANRALMHLVATKESSLFLFHALGKVLFNKRWGENPDEDAKSTKPKPPKPEKLPSHLSQWNRRASKVDTNALFSDAPVDSDMFMSYMHQNYTPFCDDLGNCDHLMSYMSDADALMRMEGDNFSRHALTSHYSFQVSVRGGLLSLPSPIQRRGQKMYKSEMWDAQKRERENLDTTLDWIAGLTRERLREQDSGRRETGDDNEELAGDGASQGSMGELLPNKMNLLLEFLPFLGLMQAPQRSFTAASATSSSSGTSGSLFAKPTRPSSLNQSTASSSLPHKNSTQKKLSKALLEIAFMPPPKVASTGLALNEKDVPDSEEAEDDEMKMKPVAPAVKVEVGDDDEDDEEELWKALEEADEEEEVTVEKLYLSDDDIDDF